MGVSAPGGSSSSKNIHNRVGIYEVHKLYSNNNKAAIAFDHAPR